MSQLFDVLGLDFKIIIAQIITFGALLAILYKIGYGPIVKFVQERRKLIEAGVNNASEAKKVLDQADAKSAELLKQANTEAQAIITAARDHAREQAEAITEQKKAELVQFAKAAKKAIEEERAGILREAREQSVELVLAATEKILEHKLDTAADTEFIQQAIMDITPDSSPETPR